jgi:hypothetical protein
MKINQIVSEHKKGVKARVYNKKGPEARKVAKQPAQPGVATAFAGQVAKEDATQQVYKVTKSDPNTGLTLSKPDGTQLILPPDKMNAIAANPNDPNKYLLNPDAIAQQATSGQPSGPEIGREVEVNTTENPDQAFGEEMDDAVEAQPGDVGGDATDAYIDDITDHDFEQAQGRLRELAGMPEGLGKTIKRGMAGWGAFDKDKPADVVKRVKDQDTDTLKGLSNRGSTGKGSPAELQQKAINRELKKRGEQGVAEGPGFDKWADDKAASQLHKLKPGMVQDRKTGKWYDPKKEFDKKMNSPEVIAQMKRMAQKEGVTESSPDDKLLQKMLTIAGLR